MLKVLHIVSGEFSGGAARGAYWLHSALLQHGVNSRIYSNARLLPESQSITSISSNNFGYLNSIINGKLDTLPLKFYRKKQNSTFDPALFGIDFTRSDEYPEADIIHLHWVNRGLLNIKDLSKVKKPIVWTMRDMWPMTGGCHYSMGCDEYKRKCGRCPQLSSNKQKDLSWYVLRRKMLNMPSDMKIVGISHWLSNCAQQSAIFHDYKVETIHNGIDLEKFSPIDKSSAKEILGLDENKSTVIVGAQEINNYHKGFNHFIEAIKYIDTKNIQFLFFGFLDESLLRETGIDYKYIGYLNDILSMRLAYSSADVCVFPSVMDAFGKVVIESLACGTPVVVFDATGPRDIIDHKIDGFKAKPFEANDLAAGINWILADKSRHADLCLNARKKAVKSFDIKKIANQYLDMYEDMLAAS